MQDAAESSGGVRVQKEVKGPENEAAASDKALSAAWPLSEPRAARSRQGELLGNVLLWKKTRCDWLWDPASSHRIPSIPLCLF